MADSSSAFDDADQLGQLLRDAKASDKKRFSTIADARNLVEEFRGHTDAGAWPSLDRNVVADRLQELLGPANGDDATLPDVAGRALQQGSMNLCGPAALFLMVIKRDPLMFATYATQLFDTGTASLGSLQVAPGDGIVGFGPLQPPHASTPALTSAIPGKPHLIARINSSSAVGIAPRQAPRL